VQPEIVIPFDALYDRDNARVGRGHFRALYLWCVSFCKRECNWTADQFQISDERSVTEMAKMLYNQGYQVAYKDWQLLGTE
jgi:hypothetical protein